MCFMTKCPYVPPHEFNIDFPHLMLRYRTLQKKKGQLSKMPQELAKIDRNAKIASALPSIANWGSNKKNTLIRKPLEASRGFLIRVFFLFDPQLAIDGSALAIFALRSIFASSCGILLS